MAVAAAPLRPGMSVARRPHSAVGKAFMAAVAVLAAAFAAVQELPEPAAPCFAALAGGGLPTLSVAPHRAVAGLRGGVAMRAEGEEGEEGEEEEEEDMSPIYKLRKWKGSARYKRYSGYVWRKKRIGGVRLRLDRWGTGHWPFYRIRAQFHKRRPNRSGRYLEALGWYNPMREVDDPKFFKLKADRCVFWLRNGGQPTDMVANLLDRIGIIRRTGPHSKYGEWEWRVPKDSGPEAPAGWSYDGPHEVTWNNKPEIRHRKGHPKKKLSSKIPLIERYGFKGYTKIPIDDEALGMPLAGDSLLESFGNTELPIYDREY